MSEEPENPPAFPQSKPIYMAQDNGDGYVNPTVVGKSVTGGLTMRDYFAAAALQGMISSESWKEVEAHDMSSCAYIYADEMLKARQS